MSQDLSKLTPEQLVELAKQGLANPADETLKSLSSCRRFIISENLTEGKEKIPAIVIYARYYEWALIHNEIISNLNEFFTDFQLYFNRKQTNKGVYYILSPAGFNLSREYLEMSKRKYSPVRRNSHGKKEKNKKEDKS